MKNIFLIITIIFCLNACQKEEIPTNYVGTWVSITPSGPNEWFQTTRTLRIPHSGQGNYSKSGVFGTSTPGEIQIKGNTLTINSKQFTINQTPKREGYGSFHMVLNGLDFYRE